MMNTVVKTMVVIVKMINAINCKYKEWDRKGQHVITNTIFAVAKTMTVIVKTLNIINCQDNECGYKDDECDCKNND